MAPDALIVGGGLAGLVAANRLAQLGWRPLVIEAGERAGYLCNTRICGGVFHVAFRTVAQRPDVLAQQIAERTCGNARPDMVRLMVANTGRVIPWLTAEGIRFVRAGPEEYQFYTLAPPKWNRPGLDWPGRGGDVLLRTLTRNLRQRSVEFWLGARATELLMDAGRCVGARVDTGGRIREVRSGAVILADGGFQADLGMLARHVTPQPRAILQRNARTGVGDGIRMAENAGAHTAGLAWFYGHLLSRDAHTNDKLWPYPVLDHLAAACLIVDQAAQRFTNEGLGGVSIANAVARLADPLSAVAIFDERAWQGRPGTYHIAPPNPHLERAGATLHRAPTLEALATLASLPVARLAQTVGEFNSAVISGELAALVPERTETRATAHTIAVPPFYAAPVCAGITYTMGGISIDTAAQALRADGQPIAGLYAAGATTGGLEGGPGAGYVGGLAKSAVMGLVAAESVAAVRRGHDHA